MSNTITKVTPASGPIQGGTLVSVTGTGFVSGCTAKFGDVPALAVVFNSATSLTVTAPPSLDYDLVYIVVINPGVDGETTTNDGLYGYFNPVQSPPVSLINPYFDPATSYSFFGQINFIQTPYFMGGVKADLPPTPPPGSVAVMWDPVGKRMYHA